MKRPFRKGLFILSVSLFVISASLCSYRIVTLNAETPSHGQIAYNLNEEAAFPMYAKMESQPTDLGARITATKCFIANRDTIKGQFQNYDDSYLDKSKLGDPKWLVVQVSFRNEGAKDVRIELGGIVAQMGSWTNGIELPLLAAMNEGVGSLVSVAPGEMKQLTIPFALYKTQFGFGDTWETLEDREFELVLATYPNKTFIKIGKPQAAEDFEGL